MSRHFSSEMLGLDSLVFTMYQFNCGNILFDGNYRKSELDIPFCMSIAEWFAWHDSLALSHNARVFLEEVGGTLLWFIWSFRNRLIFSTHPPKKASVWDDIVSQ